MSEQIARSFSPLIGLPCWGLDRIQGSMISLEFGAPHLIVREPRGSNSVSARVRERLSQRIVKPVGEWHLLIDACHWRMKIFERTVAEDTSAMSEIDAAIREMDGQKLIRTAGS